MIPEKDFAGRQSIGARENQQDTYAFAEIDGTQNSLLLVVADGMGGYRGGEEASRVAVDTFIDVFQRSHEDERSRLLKSVHAANDAIFTETEANPEDLEGMGTTLVAAVATQAGLSWASVGDSSLYIFRDESLKRLNADHSMRAVISQQIKEGRMSAEDAATHPKRTQLLSALIGEEIPLLDQSPAPLALRAGDLILMASDGLDTLSPPRIREILHRAAGRPAAEIAGILLAAVKDEAKPRQDNTTVALMKFSEEWLEGIKRDAPLGGAVAELPPVGATRRLGKSPRRSKAGKPK